MEPFTIHCDTCAARLKVRHAAMINQVLACPKCGSMVRVVPPADWKLDDETVPAVPIVKVNHPEAKKEDNAASSDFSNFDDIDDVIANESKPAATKTKTKKAQKKPAAPTIPEPPRKSRKTAKPATPESKPIINANGAPASETPILPDQNWTSGESKQRQKLILAIVAGAGILLLTIGGITAFVVNSGKSQTAQKSPDDGNSEVVDEKPDDQNTDPDNKGVSEESTTPDNNTDTDQADTDNNPTTDSTDNDPDKTPENPNSTEPENPDKIETPLVEGNPNTSDTPLVENPNKQDDWQDPLANLDGNDQVQDPLLGSSLDSATKISTRVGELNDLLSTSGMSLNSIRDVADSNRTLNFGTSKYFIEPPLEPQIRILQSLDNVLGGMTYEDIRLDRFLNDISSLTGAPISLHIESLRAAGIDWNAEVDMVNEGVKMGEAIDNAIAPLNLKKEVFPDAKQVVLVADGWDQLVEQNFQLHKLADNTPEGQANLVRKIRGMFSDKAWTDQTVIKFENKLLFVKQVPQVQHQIGRLLEKLKAVQILNSDANDVLAKELLQTEWSMSEAARKTNMTFSPTPDVTLGRFVQGLENQAQVRILIDWNSLSQMGWWPSTMVPGEFNEPTLQDSLRQLTRSMGCTYRALDEKTFEIISINEANNRPELQVYPAKKILDGVLTPELLLDTLRQTFQRDSHLVKVGYDSDSQSIIVVAPQSIQVQFEAVVDRIREGS